MQRWVDGTLESSYLCVLCFFCFFFCVFFFFFNDTATTEIYTLSLHDALPIWSNWQLMKAGMLHVCSLYAPCMSYNRCPKNAPHWRISTLNTRRKVYRQDQYIRLILTSEIGRAHVWTPVTCQNLVCRLLLEKKKKKRKKKKKKRKKKKKKKTQWRMRVSEEHTQRRTPSTTRRSRTEEQ